VLPRSDACGCPPPRLSPPRRSWLPLSLFLLPLTYSRAGFGHRRTGGWGAVTATFIALHLVDGDIGGHRDRPVPGDAVYYAPDRQGLHLDDFCLVGGGFAGAYYAVAAAATGISAPRQTRAMPVSEVIGHRSAVALLDRLPASGWPWGFVVVAVLTRDRPRWVLGPVAAVEVLAVAGASFCLGILLLTVFSCRLHWFPRDRPPRLQVATWCSSRSHSLLFPSPQPLLPSCCNADCPFFGSISSHEAFHLQPVSAPASVLSYPRLFCCATRLRTNP